MICFFLDDSKSLPQKQRFLAPSKPIFSTKTKPSWPRHFDGLVFVSWLCGNRYNHCIRSAESQHRTSTETWTNHHESSWWQFMTGTLNKKMEWLIYVLFESLALHICPRCLLNVVSFPKKNNPENKREHSTFILKKNTKKQQRKKNSQHQKEGMRKITQCFWFSFHLLFGLLNDGLPIVDYDRPYRKQSRLAHWSICEDPDHPVRLQHGALRKKGLGHICRCHIFMIEKPNKNMLWLWMVGTSEKICQFIMRLKK